LNLFELFVKIGVDDQASKNLASITGKLGNGLKTAAKIGTAAVSAAAAGITALTTAAVNNYAEYEQLVGGVETLFKKSADAVMGYASEAYKTAGMSANEYMNTVTSFSASLLQSLGGDTDKAANVANQAVTDMSDNANKMGTSIEMIQSAYQGFAKGNYTMLDNLNTMGALAA
jgi:phage-related protein